MVRKDNRYDRTTRLYRVEHILYQNPKGITVKELAQRCSVSVRTTYRDLNAIDEALQCIWLERGRCGLVEGRYLPPIRFSLPEAMRVFLAARLMLRYSNRCDSDTESTFRKLNSVLPPRLQYHVQKTLDWMQNLRADKHYQGVMHDLVEAWLNQRTVLIHYLTLGDKTAKERRIDPYFIEPAAAGHSSYVIAYCHLTKEIRVFKLERIKSIELTDEFYLTPPNFDANTYLASAWGIVAGGEAQTIKLRFDSEIAPIIEEVTWHPSQVTEQQEDGSLLMTLTVMNTVELQSWILGWGEKVKVLEPDELRRDIAKTAKAISRIYKAV